MKLLLITDTGEQVEARCDGCGHWNSALLERSGTTKQGYCDRVQLGALAFAPGIAIRSSIRTSADFGCALFEVKP